MGESHSLNALPADTVVGDYTIESELGGGGFSIVYLARHNLSGDAAGGIWRVALKEYLPAEVAGRDRDGFTVRPTRLDLGEAFEDGLRRFKQEALHLVRFQRLGNVVDCLNLFEANGTAYLVMEYDDGLPLSTFLRLREEQGSPCSEDDLLAVMVPLLECLVEVHRAEVLHRDIKPGNIFVRRADDVLGRPAEPMLLDFGAAKQDYLGKHSRSGAPYTPGYAAFEQTSSMGAMGPWTDIYALGVTMWRMVAGGNVVHVRAHGANPVDALPRNYALSRGEGDPMPSAAELGAGRFSPHVLTAIDRCLTLYPEERPQNCGELLGLLNGEADSGAGRGAPTKRRIVERNVPRSGERFRDALSSGGKGPLMVVVPTGRFRMGMAPAWGSKYKKPIHDVTIARPFALGMYEVTIEQWDECAAGGGCAGYWPDDEGWGRSSRPVINVSWEDAQSYVSWLSVLTGEAYRLPSESEWEYAARAGTVTKYSWGNEIGHNQANCDGCGSRWDGKQTAPVGSFASNAFGLHDMHGNVLEWVEDCWNPSYRGAPADGAAWTTGDCEKRVLRGGSWLSPPRYLRSANRYRNSSSIRVNYYGFRVARTLTP